MKKIVTYISITLLLLAVVIPLVLGFRSLGIPSWPVLAFVFYFGAFLKMDFSKLKETTAGSLIGIAIPFSSPILCLINKGLGETVFLLLLIGYITVLLSDKSKYINNAGNLYILCLTAVVPGETSLRNLLPITAEIVGTTILFWLFGKVRSSRKAPHKGRVSIGG
jgi:hypothetical protein